MFTRTLQYTERGCSQDRFEIAKAKVAEEHLRQELETTLEQHSAEKKSMAAQIVNMRERVEKETTLEYEKQRREELNRQIENNKNLLDELETAIFTNHELEQANHNLDCILSRLRNEFTALKTAVDHAVNGGGRVNSLETFLDKIDRFLDEE